MSLGLLVPPISNAGRAGAIQSKPLNWIRMADPFALSRRPGRGKPALLCTLFHREAVPRRWVNPLPDHIFATAVVTLAFKLP